MIEGVVSIAALVGVGALFLAIGVMRVRKIAAGAGGSRGDAPVPAPSGPDKIYTLSDAYSAMGTARCHCGDRYRVQRLESSMAGDGRTRKDVYSTYCAGCAAGRDFTFILDTGSPEFDAEKKEMLAAKGKDEPDPISKMEGGVLFVRAVPQEYEHLRTHACGCGGAWKTEGQALLIAPGIPARWFVDQIAAKCGKCGKDAKFVFAVDTQSEEYKRGA